MVDTAATLYKLHSTWIGLSNDCIQVEQEDAEEGEEQDEEAATDAATR